MTIDTDNAMTQLRMYSYSEAEIAVIRWSEARGIIPHATTTSQLLKAVSELGELADAEAQRNREKIKDGVGDVVVSLINYCTLHDLSLVDCLIEAYAQIKDRKGRLMPDGTFVKEE